MQIINQSGRILELTGSSLTVERNNSLFNDEDKILQDVTYQSQAGLTPSNIIFIESGHLVEARKQVYAQPVQVFSGGYQFYNAIFTYEINNGEINFILKINFGAIADKVKNTLMCEIFTGDGIDAILSPAYMKMVCENPADYPYSYFPIYSEAENPLDGPSPFTINPWDHAAQTFITGATSTGSVVNAVFWKLSHYLKKIAEYLNLTVVGSYMDDPKNDQIYLYNKVVVNVMYGSTIYLPQSMSIAEFLKICKTRFHISFAPDLMRGTVAIDQGSSMLKRDAVRDLSDYMSSINTISPPAENGYSITLKPDESDLAFQDPLNEGSFLPTHKLNVGDGAKVIEMNCSTLKEKVLAEYTLPLTKQAHKLKFNGAPEDWQLSFLRYPGMQVLGNGKMFPRAYPMELNIEDSVWYKFLNSAKKIKLSLNLPPTVLATFDTSEKIGFISEQGTNQIAIPSKNSYQLTADAPEVIKTIVECYTFGDDDTEVEIIPIVPALEEEEGRSFFKAFFNSEITGLTRVEFEVYYEKKRVGDSASNGIPFTHKDVILTSTNEYAIGGSKTFIPAVSSVRGSLTELRIRNGVPKYALKNGRKIDFLQRDGYYYATHATSSSDGQGVWIVF